MIQIAAVGRAECLQHFIILLDPGEIWGSTADLGAGDAHRTRPRRDRRRSRRAAQALSKHGVAAGAPGHTHPENPLGGAPLAFPFGFNGGHQGPLMGS